MTLTNALGRSLDWEDNPLRLTVREVFKHIVNLQTEVGIRYSLIDDPVNYQPRSAVMVPIPNVQQGESLVLDLTMTPTVFSPFLPSRKPLDSWMAVIEDWIDYLIENDFHLAISYIETDSFASLVGLGPGKTPAGDDLLTGYITGLRWLRVNEASAVCTQVLTNLSATDWLSQNMIIDACNAKTSAAALDLCNALSGSNPTRLRRATSRIVSMGHTSGRSWLAGFGLALFSQFYREGRYDEAYENSSG